MKNQIRNENQKKNAFSLFDHEVILAASFYGIAVLSKCLSIPTL